ncbi:MAG: DUF4383 domain-containing protein [Anaerolineae bacterium]
MAVRWFALIVGVLYLLFALLGFLGGHSPFPVKAPDLAVNAGYGLLLGIFSVNVLHNIVHLLIGLWGVLAYSQVASAVAFAKAMTVFLGVLAIMGLIPGLNTVFGLVPLYGNDVWLHAVTALVAAYFGWGGPSREDVMV